MISLGRFETRSLSSQSSSSSIRRFTFGFGNNGCVVELVDDGSLTEPIGSDEEGNEEAEDMKQVEEVDNNNEEGDKEEEYEDGEQEEEEEEVEEEQEEEE